MDRPLRESGSRRGGSRSRPAGTAEGQPEREGSTEAAPALPGRLLWALLLGVACLRAALVFTPSMHLWGFNVQRFLPPVRTWLLWGVMVVPLLPGPGDVMSRVMGAVERWWGRRPGLGYLAAALLACGMIAALPDRVWFVGDFLQRVGAVEIGRFGWVFPQSLPLDEFLRSTLPQGLALSPEQAALAFPRALGILEAVIFALLAVAFARLAAERGSVAPVFAAVFFGGYLAVFTGYGRSAGEQTLLTLAMGLTGLRLVRGRGGLAHALVLAAALALHRSMLVLLPAATYLWGRRLAGARGRILRESAPLVVPLVTLALVAPRLAGIVKGYDLKYHLAAPAAAAHGGWLGAAVGEAHLLDLVNVVGILSPLALPLAALALLWRSPRFFTPELRYLLVLALSFIPLLLFVHPQQGLFRDWDVFAPAGVALSMLSAWYLAKTLPGMAMRARLGAALTVALFVPTVGLLLHNHDVEHGLERVRALLTGPPVRSEGERLKTLDFLGNRNYGLGRWDASAGAFAQEASLEPAPLVLLRWAMAETERGNLRGARALYRRVLARDSSSEMAWMGYGALSSRLGELDESQRALKELLRRKPNNAEARTLLQRVEQLQRAKAGGTR